jgi:hypothetical protein
VNASVSDARFDACTWACIYGGLLLLFLAPFGLRQGAAFGWALGAAGALATAAGATMIWRRSRRS